MSERLGRAVLELVTDPTKLRAGMAAARAETLSSLGAAQKALTDIGHQMTATGSQMTRGITVPVIAAGAAIFEVGATFEHSLSEIVGLVGVSREQINKWRPEIEGIAEATGIGPERLAKALYFIASSGLDASKAMDVLTLAAKAAEAGMGDVEVIAGVLTSAVNAYARQNLDAATATDVLTRAIQVGSAEPQDFANALGTVAPAAAQLNVKFTDLLGTLAVLSRVNKNMAEDSTSLGQIFNTLLKPTTKTAEALDSMGLSAAQLRQELAEHGLMAMLRLLASHIGDDDEAIAHIFPNIRALRGVLNLTGQDAANVDKAMAQVADSTGALDAAVVAVSNDASVLASRDLAKIQDDLILLGRDVIPLVVTMFDKLAGGVHSAATWFVSLPAGVRETVVQGAALLAVVGPILIVLGSIVGAIGGLIGAGGALATLLTVKLIPGFVALATAILSTSIEAFATAIFATGIPALERLAIALLGADAAAGPLVIALAAIAGGVALANQAADEGVRQLADLDQQGKLTALTLANIAYHRGMDVAALRAEINAEEARRAALAESERASADAAKATDMAAVSAHIASERADEQASSQRDVAAAYRGSAKQAVDMEASLREALSKAFADEQKFASDTLGEIQKFRSALESAFKATQDASTDAAETQAKIVIAVAGLAAMEKDYTAHHKGWTAEQLAQWKLGHIGAVKELAELRFHAGLIGTAMQQEQALTALLTSKDMLAGLTSKFPEIRAAYESLRADSLASLWALAQKGGVAGKAAALELQKYLDPKNPASPLHNASSWGGKTAAEWVAALAAIISGSVAPGGAISTALSRVRAHMRATSPPGPESELHEIGPWGHRTGLEYVDRFADAIATLAGRISAPLHAAAAVLGAPMGSAGLSLAMADAGIGAATRHFPLLPDAASDVARAHSGATGPLVVIEHLDASGHSSPGAVGHAVRQQVGDLMADIVKKQDARLPIGTRS